MNHPLNVLSNSVLTRAGQVELKGNQLCAIGSPHSNFRMGGSAFKGDLNEPLTANVKKHDK